MFENHFIVPIDAEAKYLLFENIKESTLKEFWHVHSSKRDSTGCDLINKGRLSLNINGKFIDYIEKKGKTDTLFYDLHSIIITIGDIPITGTITFLAENNSVDFKKIEYRLLAVVCLLSMDEPVEKPEG
jgi:hypothetical protein